MKLVERSSEFQQIIETLEIGDECFWEPMRVARPGAWTGHLATAFWLVKVVRPRMLVELGTHSGNSYSAFCQAVSRLGLPSRAFAVDTWKGDEHAGFYDESVFQDLNAFNQSHFAGFSRLVRSTFDDARAYFTDGSIDLLHIDGLHTYEAVKHDFETWKSAASSSAVVLFHDTNVRERGFGVWQFWLELSQAYPYFEFNHAEGLGILGLGPRQPPQLVRLFELSQDPQAALMVRQLFAARGEAFLNAARCLDLEYLVSVLSQRAAETDSARQEATSLRDQITAINVEAANLRDQMIAINVELDRLRQVEAAAREQDVILSKALNDAAAVPALQAELARLRDIEATALQQSAGLASLVSEASSARDETVQYKLAQEGLEKEVARLHDDLCSIREHNDDLASELERTRDEACAAQAKLEASMSLARQQSLTAQRSLLEVMSARQELERSRQELERSMQELAQYKSAYEQAAALLIPLRIRRVLPEPLKPPLRAVKRALRSLVRR